VQASVQCGRILICLIGIFFVFVSASLHSPSLIVIHAIKGRSAWYSQVIHVEHDSCCEDEPRGASLQSLVEIGPINTILHSCIHHLIKNLILPWLQCKDRYCFPIALKITGLMGAVLPTNDSRFAFGNMRGTAADIHDTEFQSGVLLLSQLREIKVGDRNLPNNNLRTILQKQGSGFYLPSFLHFGELAFHVRGLCTHSLPLEPHIASLPFHLVGLALHYLRLAAVDYYLPNKREELQKPDDNQQTSKCFDFPLYLCIVIGLGCGGLNFGGWMLIIGRKRWRLLGWLVLAVSAIGLLTDLGTLAFGRPLSFWRFGWLLGKDEYCNNQPLHGEKLYHKKYLTFCTYCNTVSLMANVLSADKQTAIIAALAEGSSIRSIERITGVHRDTIMRLGVRVGKGCEMLMDSKMQDLGCNYLQLDEVWGFIGKKERHCSVDDNPELGDVWTFCAIDSETKLVPSFKCGKRTSETANAFVQDIANRVRNRVQISTDALGAYGEAVERAFGADVDYGQIVKVYTHDAAQHPERKYSAPHFASAYRRPIAGNPEREFISTSHVERLNATTRLHVKRLSRLTLAFSKKFENFQAAVALHFAYYNFVRRHNTLRCTPAMAAGVERDFWSVGQLVEATI